MLIKRIVILCNNSSKRAQKYFLGISWNSDSILDLLLLDRDKAAKKKSQNQAGQQILCHDISHHLWVFFLVRNIDENTAQKMIDDAHKCINQHLGDCPDGKWNFHVYTGNIEMIAHTAEKSCNIEIGTASHCNSWSVCNCRSVAAGSLLACHPSKQKSFSLFTCRDSLFGRSNALHELQLSNRPATNFQKPVWDSWLYVWFFTSEFLQVYSGNSDKVYVANATRITGFAWCKHVSFLSLQKHLWAIQGQLHQSIWVCLQHSQFMRSGSVCPTWIQVDLGWTVRCHLLLQNIRMPFRLVLQWWIHESKRIFKLYLWMNEREV